MSIGRLTSPSRACYTGLAMHSACFSAQSMFQLSIQGHHHVGTWQLHYPQWSSHYWTQIRLPRDTGSEVYHLSQNVKTLAKPNMLVIGNGVH